MIPVLRVLSDGQEHGLRDVFRDTAAAEQLTPEQMGAILQSGQPMVENRIGWAASYLARVGAVDRPRRGRYVITDLGCQLLAEQPDGITEAHLRALARPGDEWWAAKRSTTPVTEMDEPPASVLDPTEQIEQGVSRIHEDVAVELLRRLLDRDPAFFEQAVVRLLVAMGYGGTHGAGAVTPQSGDEGIDGIIDQDALGLRRVYLQAKRYAIDRPVGRPDLQAFVGALHGKADAGVFITTARFSREAEQYVTNVPTRLVLIDGRRLTELMIRYRVGVQAKDTYHVVELDEDFFA